MMEEKKPIIVFLTETKLNLSIIETVKRRMGFDECLVVEAEGKKGVLALLWKYENEVEITNFFTCHINACVLDDRSNSKWLLTSFYGHLDTEKKKESWKLLANLKPLDQSAWYVLRDFNELVSQNENMEGKHRDEKQIRGFMGVLEATELYDLGCQGDGFTLSNKHLDDTFTKERLDRVVANNLWIYVFNNTNERVLTTLCSDHKPLLRSVITNSPSQRRGSYQFKYKTS